MNSGHAEPKCENIELMRKFKKPRMDPHAFHGHIPLSPHDLIDRQTRTQDLFSLAHFGIPIIEASDWRLEITGLVNQPKTLSLDDIKALAKRRINTIHQCAGSPLDPTAPKRRISNVEWAGADLKDLLDDIGVDSKARYIWSYAPDYGEFGGYTQEFYLKDLPLERVARGDVLLAYELNGEPLPHKHGFPVRLLIPGYYGTNSVKWVSAMELSENRPDSVFTTKLYVDRAAAGDDKTTDIVPVREIAPEAIIVSPANGATANASGLEIWGWAWAETGARAVDLSMDQGKTWHPAELEARTQWSWQKFTFDWRPEHTGQVTIIARATDNAGNTQPMDGGRNAVHAVQVTVSEERRD